MRLEPKSIREGGETQGSKGGRGLPKVFHWCLPLVKSTESLSARDPGQCSSQRHTTALESKEANDRNTLSNISANMMPEYKTL